MQYSVLCSVQCSVQCAVLVPVLVQGLGTSPGRMGCREEGQLACRVLSHQAPPCPTMSHDVPARPCLQCGGLSRPVLESCQAGSSRREGQEEEEELGADHAALHCSSASVGNLGVNILIE